MILGVPILVLHSRRFAHPRPSLLQIRFPGLAQSRLMPTSPSPPPLPSAFRALTKIHGRAVNLRAAQPYVSWGQIARLRCAHFTTLSQPRLPKENFYGDDMCDRHIETIPAIRAAFDPDVMLVSRKLYSLLRHDPYASRTPPLPCSIYWSRLTCAT